MFNYDVLENPLKIENHDAWIFSHLIPKNSYDQLSAAYPTQGFIKHPKQPGNPNQDTIRYDHAEFITLSSREQFKMIAPIWQEFYNTITAEKYLSLLGKVTDLDLSNIDVHLNFAQYHPGGFLSEHYDRQPKKILTQVFYFNEDWTVSEGGSFDILTSTSPRKCRFTISPDRIYSNVVKCNDSAWHEVKLVTGQRVRRTVNIEYLLKN